MAEVVGYLKGKSAIAVARQFGGKQKNFNGEKLWARGYAASTVGFNEVEIKNYALLPSIDQGVRTALHAQNRSPYMDQIMVLQQSSLLRAELLFDPQTAGAWISLIDPEHVDNIITDLHSCGLTDASIIGHVDSTPSRHKITLLADRSRS